MEFDDAFRSIPQSRGVHPRAWMIATLPNAAIVCGCATTFGGYQALLWVFKYRPDPEDVRTAAALNAALDQVVSRDDWIRAGLPDDPAEPTSEPVGLGARLKSQRTLGTPDRRGSFELEAHSKEDARKLRRMLVEGGSREHTSLESVQPAGVEGPDRSRHAFTFMHEKGRRRLIGWCFHDGVFVLIELEGWATEEEATVFLRRLRAFEGRLYAACSGELAEYMERAEAEGATPR